MVDTEVVILVIAGAVFLIVLVAGRLPSIWLTEPVVAIGLGVLVGVFATDPIELDHPAVLVFLELTLALVLFGDAARINVGRLRRDYAWPSRMLLIGLPLAMVGGAILTGWLLAAPLGLALLAGVILAPTDAALAEPVLESKRLPGRVRQTLNIESGLNDGLALPALFIAIGLIEAETEATTGDAVILVLQQVGIGLLGGLVFGALGAVAISRGTEHRWMSPLHQKIAAVALALVTFSVTQLLGGSGFVATFVAGAVLGRQVRPHSEYLYEFAEAEGRTLVLIAFLLVGAGPVYLLIERGADAEIWLLALLSLFVVRPVAIAISLLGQDLMRSTTVFLGWFGPRGLATIVFMLVAFEDLGEFLPEILDLVIATVALSALLHGLSATPLSNWLGRRIEAQEDEEMPEMGEAFEHPTRAVSRLSPR